VPPWPAPRRYGVAPRRANKVTTDARERDLRRSRSGRRHGAAAEHARRRAGVVEPGDPREHDRDQEAPPRDGRAPDARSREAADRGGDRLRPRLALAQVARGDHDAALERREAETADEQLAADDRGDHPRREDALVEE